MKTYERQTNVSIYLLLKWLNRKIGKNTQMQFKGTVPIIPWVFLYTLVLLGMIKRRNITATKQMACGTRLHTSEIREKQCIQLLPS